MQHFIEFSRKSTGDYFVWFQNIFQLKELCESIFVSSITSTVSITVHILQFVYLVPMKCDMFILCNTPKGNSVISLCFTVPKVSNSGAENQILIVKISCNSDLFWDHT